MTEQSPAGSPQGTPAADATSGAPATPATPAEPGTPATPATPAATTAITNAETDAQAKPEGDANADAPQVPEKYELAAPEGFTLEPETTAQFETIAREMKLTNEQANKLVPLAAQLVQKQVAKQQEAHATQVQKWLESSKTDKDFGGEKFDASIKQAKVAVEKFGTPLLKELLDGTGLGNHPEVIRLFHRIGNAIAEDSLVVAPSAGGTASAASVLFDHPSSQTR